MNLSREVFNNYFSKKISDTEFEKEIGINTDEFPVALNNEIKSTTEKQDSEMLEFLIYALFWWNDRGVNKSTSLEYFSQVLNELIIVKWHTQHENIVMLIQKIGNEESIEYLNKAIYLQLEYLEWDDNYAFQTKCVRALASIGGTKAVTALKAIAEIDNPIIKKLAKRKLAEITNH